ncbi:MAG: response regulator [Oscillospiraceae bacterium]|nr:response regulator [Oscillospiraceae bacterium]
MNWIVVADSDVSTLRDAGQILCRQKMRVTGFKSAQTLLDFLRDNQPDLILLGNVIWELGGFEAISALQRAAKPGEDIPVLLMAEPGNRDQEESAQAKGAAGIINKPLEPAMLTARVQELLALREKRERNSLPTRSNLEEIASSLEECNDASNGMWMGREVFGNVYRHMLRYMERYHGIAFQVLFTVEMPKDTSETMRAEIMTQFRRQLQHTLRESDMMLESGENQVFLLLPEVHESDIAHVIFRVIDEWKRTEYGPITGIDSEVRRVDLDDGKSAAHNRKGVDWVVVVDDDVTNLKMAGTILSRQHMRVTALKSGRALLDYVRDNRPDLILLDVRMPEMDGFETLRRLKQETSSGQEIPVIFLTADENAESEMRGLELGAMDFIKKPFVPEVLTLRVRHIIELVRLQKNLADEVEIKTQENENLSLRIVQTLAEAIDAKDNYTNGHSGRVAKYTREIARRFGYSQKRQDEIYMMGLLHDVGKIGVPDAVINKPAKLTEEEYAQIKTHPVMGDRILKNIRERPKLAVGARWHHERYDGTGYPDGLSGDKIPEEARIIAVADAYDAMTSRRSYRGILPQDIVRNEIKNGKGKQFDPAFADIMLTMIEEDKDYILREK